jgi:hypothetical protein
MCSLARAVRPEWLDLLPPDDPRAVRSRRDLRRINSWMLQPHIMAGALAKYCPQTPRHIVDLGAGDGAFMLQVARRLGSRWQGVTLTLLDRHDLVSAETKQHFQAIGWLVTTVAADAFDFLQQDNPAIVDVITTNLFLHHFPEIELARLLALIAQRTDAMVACEPRRAPLALAASHLVWGIGCNDVSRHDAVVSVRAGFNDREISASWPEPEFWALYEGPEMLFTHRFVARRSGRKST